MRNRLQFRRTTIMTIGFTAFLCGLAIARFNFLINVEWILFALVAVGISLRRRNIMTILAVSLLGTLVGVARGNAFMAELTRYEAFYGKQITLQAKADKDSYYDDNGQLEIDATNVKVLEPYNQSLLGIVKVQGYGTPTIYRGDIVQVRGKLFPTRGSKQARISYSEIKVVGRSGQWSEKTRREFVAGMQTAMPEPQASFGLGLLVGQRATLPDEVIKHLSIAGLTHIIAVSGYNLTIIVRGVRRLLGQRSKYQSTVISMFLVGCFLLFTGFSASIVRASIVSLLSLAAWYYGRSFKPILLITLAAAITAGWNPLYIWSDIGWHLSFLAFFGVMVIAPLIKRRLFGTKQPKFLGQVVLESMSAQIMAAPLILFIFSEVSIVALLSNAIIVPLVPFAMLFSLIGGIAGMVLPLAAGLIAWPATVLTTYMLDLAALFARIPNASIQTTLPLSGMIVLYSLIVFVTLIMYQKLKAKYGIITDKNIIE